MIKAGFRFKIYLVFDRDKNNEIGFHAQIEPELSENMDEHKVRQYLKVAIEVAEDPSDTDKQQLDFWK